MAVQRRVNFISQQRVDVPDIRSLESAASNDFDQLIQTMVTGTGQGYILRGFEILMAGAIGGAASGLQMLVDPGAVLHIASSQSGTFMLVPSGTAPEQLNSATNPKVLGAFAPSAVNYVGVEYTRFIDDTTAAQVFIWDPTAKNETTKIAPRAQILTYNLVITTTIWAANVLPISIVVTDAGNNVVDISDARWRLGRLGTGGASPDAFHKYPWTSQSEGRTENPSVSNSNSVNPFRGGDKMLGSLKEWMDAVMTTLLEVKGTTYWYSQGTAGSLESLREDLGNTLVTGNSNISHSKTVAGRINWASKPTPGSGQIYLKVMGSRLFYQIAENPSGTAVTLSDNQAAYITLIRGVSVIPNLVFTPNIGPNSTTVQSVGNVTWTTNLQAGDWIRASADTDANYYKISTVDSLSQVTLAGQYVIANITAQGVSAVYAFGSYTLPGATGTARDIVIANREAVPTGQNTVWLLLRSDDSGTIPRVYIKFLGAELQQGESEEISGPQIDQVIQYIGSPIESASAPNYTSAVNPSAVPQITEITLGAASTITTGQYFLINSSADARNYYVWFKKDGAGADPAAPFTNAAVQVNITTGQTSAQVANAVATAMSGVTPNDFLAIQESNPNQNKILVTNNSAGTSTSATNFNVSAPFAISITQAGVGDGNSIINDGDNLTLAIKKLDDAIGSMLAAAKNPAYDEPVDIVLSGATPPISLNGPISATTVITLPNNSRFGNIAQKYVVGKGTLLVFLNGQYLRLGVDWSELGTTGTLSTQITTLIALKVGDTLEFRIAGSGGGGGGGGGTQGPPGPTGPSGPAGADAVGGPIAISTKVNNYTVQLSDNVLKGDCTSGTITFMLPTVASAAGHVFWFKKIDASVNPLHIQANGTELIDDLNIQDLTVQFESFILIPDGGTWSIF